MNRLSLLSLFHGRRARLAAVIHADLPTSLCSHGLLVFDSGAELGSNQFITEKRK